MHVLVVFGNGGGLIGRSQLPTLSFTTFPVAYTKSAIIFSFTLRFTGYHYSSLSCICLLPRQSCSNGEHARSSVSYFCFFSFSLNRSVTTFVVNGDVLFFALLLVLLLLLLLLLLTVIENGSTGVTLLVLKDQYLKI